MDFIKRYLLFTHCLDLVERKLLSIDKKEYFVVKTFV